MRDQLRSLEGQLVTVVGRNKERRRNDDGRTFAMIKNAIIRPWDGNSAIDVSRKKPAIQVDHVWIMQSPHVTGMRAELLTSTITVGTVGFYTRADGSIDLGIRDICRVCNLDSMLRYLVDIHEAMMSCKQWDQTVEAVDNLRSIQDYLAIHGKRNEHGERQYALTKHFTIPELRKWVDENLNYYLGIQATLLRAKVGHLPRRSADTQSPPPGSAIFLGKQTRPHSDRPKSELEKLLRDGC